MRMEHAVREDAPFSIKRLTAVTVGKGIRSRSFASWVVWFARCFMRYESAESIESSSPSGAQDRSNKVEKRCSKCGKSKSLDGFYTKGHRSDSACKSCVLKTKAQRRREKLRAARRKSIDGSFRPSLRGNVSRTAKGSFPELFAASLKELIENGKV